MNDTLAYLLGFISGVCVGVFTLILLIAFAGGKLLSKNQVCKKCRERLFGVSDGKRKERKK
jgi:hypothetical protein